MDARTQQFIDKLREMRSLLERGWCQQYSAVNASGEYVHPKDAAAHCWCMYGAAKAVNLPPFIFVGSRRPYRGMVNWNDAPKRAQAEVLACIDNSIEALIRPV